MIINVGIVTGVITDNFILQQWHDTQLPRVATYSLTQCILVDSSTVICWTSPFVILGVSGLFCHIYSIFNGKSC